MKGKDLAIKYKTILNSYGINTPIRLAYFFGQLHHESGNFKLQRESLNYSVSGLLATFSRNRISEVDANKYGRTLTQPANQVAIANILYGGDFGKKQLGNIKKDDGYFFRGGGFIQITGRANYQALSNDTGIDFIANPDIITQESNALISALWFWKKHNLNSYSDKRDINGQTKRINGGLIGIEDRRYLINEYLKIFKK